MTQSTPTSVPPEEQEQLLQTIEMFEVIVQANPHDTQSIEILKDAYSRLGMKRELVRISQRLAQSLVEMGQFSAAIVEFEHILKIEPDNPEVIAMLGDAEEQLHRSSSVATRQTTTNHAPGEAGSLMTTSATHRPDGFRHTSPNFPGASPETAAGGGGAGAGAGATDGNESLAKFLIQNRLAPDEVVTPSLERVQRHNASLRPGTLGMALIDEVIKRGADLEQILAGILDRTKFAYVPLEYYDVDRHVVKMLPEDLTLSRLILPFDVMSRTVMVATANPFDSAGKEAAQKLLDYNIQWHLASPDAISRVLTQAYRLRDGGMSPARETPAVASTEAPIFGEMPSTPMPELRVTTGSPAQAPPPSSEPAAKPLPDTSAFRLKS